MGARGRKSAAELTTISGSGLAITRRPEPPAYLSEDAAEIWRSIVNSLSADWISPGSLPLLEALCGLTISQRYALMALQRIEEGADSEFDIEEWRGLQRQCGDLSARIAALATRLRLTPQSRYTPATAARRAQGAPGAGRRLYDRGSPAPWEE